MYIVMTLVIHHEPVNDVTEQQIAAVDDVVTYVKCWSKWIKV